MLREGDETVGAKEQQRQGEQVRHPQQNPNRSDAGNTAGELELSEQCQKRDLPGTERKQEVEESKHGETGVQFQPAPRGREEAVEPDRSQASHCQARDHSNSKNSEIHLIGNAAEIAEADISDHHKENPDADS